MFRVGNYLNPHPNDPGFPDYGDARAQAEQQAAQCSKTPIAVWGADDETLSLFFNGEEFRRV